MSDAQRLYEQYGFRRVPQRDRLASSSGREFELWAYLLDAMTQPADVPQI